MPQLHQRFLSELYERKRESRYGFRKLVYCFRWYTRFANLLNPSYVVMNMYILQQHEWRHDRWYVWFPIALLTHLAWEKLIPNFFPHKPGQVHYAQIELIRKHQLQVTTSTQIRTPSCATPQQMGILPNQSNGTTFLLSFNCTPKTVKLFSFLFFKIATSAFFLFLGLVLAPFKERRKNLGMEFCSCTALSHN